MSTEPLPANSEYAARASGGGVGVTILKTVFYWATWGAVDPYAHAKIQFIDRGRPRARPLKVLDYRDRPSLRDADLMRISGDLRALSTSEFTEKWMAEEGDRSRAYKVLAHVPRIPMTGRSVCTPCHDSLLGAAASGFDAGATIATAGVFANLRAARRRKQR